MAKAVQAIAQRIFLSHDDPRSSPIGQGFLDVTVVMDDGAILHAFYDGNGHWIGWEDLGVPTPGKPVGYRPSA